MTIVFIFLVFLVIVMSLADRNSKNNPKKIIIDTSMFRCSPSFIAGSIIIMGILTALYTVFW
jgi:SSS family solute:Na+ symporter